MADQKKNKTGKLGGLVFKCAQFFYLRYIKSQSHDEDLKRKEFILSIILIGNLFLLFIATSISFINYFKMADEYGGMPPYFVAIIFLFFLCFYIFTRLGFVKIVSFILIGIYFFITVLLASYWGVDLPVVLLFSALTIIISGILINTFFALIFSCFNSSVLIFLFLLQRKDVIIVNDNWRIEDVNISDILFYIVILFVITLVSWLSNREIEKSLKRARKSEKDLKLERDNLEKTVEERTKELKKMQMEKMGQLYRFAEFGRLSSGLFHDLVNPITAISLNLEQIKENGVGKIKEVKHSINQAVKVTKRMEKFVVAVKKQIQKQESSTNFSLTEEVIQCVQIFSYKARKSNIVIHFNPLKDVWTYGDAIKFNQVVTNLISNAVDSFDEGKVDKKDRFIKIKLYTEDNYVYFKVEDNGNGILEKHLDHIWEPFYTTKSFEKGTGIGLSSTKNIIEKDFKGEIKVFTVYGYGTEFRVVFPLRKLVSIK